MNKYVYNVVIIVPVQAAQPDGNSVRQHHTIRGVLTVDQMIEQSTQGYVIAGTPQIVEAIKLGGSDEG